MEATAPGRGWRLVSGPGRQAVSARGGALRVIDQVLADPARLTSSHRNR
jgi:hypothetical protein